MCRCVVFVGGLLCQSFHLINTIANYVINIFIYTMAEKQTNNVAAAVDVERENEHYEDITPPIHNVDLDAAEAIKDQEEEKASFPTNSDESSKEDANTNLSTYINHGNNPPPSINSSSSKKPVFKAPKKKVNKIAFTVIHSLHCNLHLPGIPQRQKNGSFLIRVTDKALKFKPFIMTTIQTNLKSVFNQKKVNLLITSAPTIDKNLLVQVEYVEPLKLITFSVINCSTADIIVHSNTGLIQLMPTANIKLLPPSHFNATNESSSTEALEMSETHYGAENLNYYYAQWMNEFTCNAPKLNVNYTKFFKQLFLHGNFKRINVCGLIGSKKMDILKTFITNPPKWVERLIFHNNFHYITEWHFCETPRIVWGTIFEVLGFVTEFKQMLSHPFYHYTGEIRFKTLLQAINECNDYFYRGIINEYNNTEMRIDPLNKVKFVTSRGLIDCYLMKLACNAALVLYHFQLLNRSEINHTFIQSLLNTIKPIMLQTFSELYNYLRENPDEVAILCNAHLNSVELDHNIFCRGRMIELSKNYEPAPLKTWNFGTNFYLVCVNECYKQIFKTLSGPVTDLDVMFPMEYEIPQGSMVNLITYEIVQSRLRKINFDNVANRETNNSSVTTQTLITPFWEEIYSFLRQMYPNNILTPIGMSARFNFHTAHRCVSMSPCAYLRKYEKIKMPTHEQRKTQADLVQLGKKLQTDDCAKHSWWYNDDMQADIDTLQTYTYGSTTTTTTTTANNFNDECV